MKWLLSAVALVLALAACKPKEVPYQPPPKDDAAAAAADAAADVDAAVAETKAQATKLVVADHASCALLTDATVRCWGRNAHGQLGDGTTTDAPTPVKPNLRGVKDIVLGNAHACALLDDESVTCWGRINYGPKTDLLAPAAAPGVAKAKRIFAVGAASCATLSDESLVCWGNIDARGHLRLSGSGAMRAPTPSAALDRVVALTSNGALREDGTVWFWATDGVPVRTAMKDVIEIASSGEEVCGLRRDGSVACAGPATRCAAAAPKPAKAVPQQAATKKPAAKKTAAKKTAAKKTAAKKAPAPKTAKGTAKPAAKLAAKPVAKPDPELAKLLPVEVLRLPPAKHLAFDVGLCVVTKTGKLQCLATADACRVDAPWPGLAAVDYVIGNCARGTNGDARCWAVDTKSRVVSEVAGVAGAIAVAASSSHACAVLGDRSVVCWGSNKFGALGRSKADEQAHREASPVTF